MKAALLTLAGVWTFSSSIHLSSAHSWLECTDYRMTPGSDDERKWNDAICYGRARCGQRQMDAGFGVDTGLNYHSGSGCQCERSTETYSTIPKAVYSPGQTVCLAYPSKNHVAAECTNGFIPDSGTIITRTSASPISDADSAFTKTYEHKNGKHQDGSFDYKGFQHCPNFCQDKDHALCTMCFTLENDIAPGDYTFKWMWSFNSPTDTYSTCWEAEVKDGSQTSTAATNTTTATDIANGYETSETPAATTITPSVTTTGATPTTIASNDSVKAEDAGDCEEELPEPNDEEDCEKELPEPADEEGTGTEGTDDHDEEQSEVGGEADETVLNNNRQKAHKSEGNQHRSADESEDCEKDLPEPDEGSEEDCETDLPEPADKEDSEDCDDELPEPQDGEHDDENNFHNGAIQAYPEN